jgi:hypothetical protein
MQMAEERQREQTQHGRTHAREVIDGLPDTTEPLDSGGGAA